MNKQVFNREASMKLLFFVLNKTEKRDDVIAELARRDIKGATVIESVGAARLLSQKYDDSDLPFLASLRQYLNPEREKNLVIFTVIKDSQLEAAVEAIEFVVGDLSCQDTGVVFSVPIDFSKGFCEVGL